MTTKEIQNASSLLALLHGKSDSICKVFGKEIVVTVEQLRRLNLLINEKLSLHDVLCVTAAIDVALSNKKVITFKSWDEFELYKWDAGNEAIASVFLQWDFFLQLQHAIPQRHTINVRISSSPKPSEFFKVILRCVLSYRGYCLLRVL